MIFEKIFYNSDHQNSFLLNQLAKVYNSPKDKFKLLESVNNNIFLSSSQKEEFLNNFQKMQKIYFSFNKFISNFPQKKNIVNFDMNLSPIIKHSKNIISINHFKVNYLFSIIDLIKIIELALCNSDSLFSKPLKIKNPFDNTEFSIANLYNIYFFIKFNTYYHSDLFHKFFMENFDLYSFTYKYEYLLREQIIKKFVFTSSVKTIKKEILDMIEKFYFYQKKKKKFLSSTKPINKDFPVDKLIKIFKPYLYVFYQSRYSLVEINKNNNYNKFIHQMNNFWQFNPNFGRKYIYVKSQFQLNYKKPLRIVEYSFDDKHIKYNDNNMQSVDSNILSVNQRVSNIAINSIINNIILEESYNISIVHDLTHTSELDENHYYDDTDDPDEDYYEDDDA